MRRDGGVTEKCGGENETVSRGDKTALGNREHSRLNEKRSVIRATVVTRLSASTALHAHTHTHTHTQTDRQTESNCCKVKITERF